ncbi:MAG: MFS transporter [Betaproteobacteria bacterium]|nr:MFS transporter [Betaproteobacteria bacterium]
MLFHSAASSRDPLPRLVRHLMMARGARSFGQGALVAAFTLYLHALHWSASAIGATLTAALLLGALVTLAVGPSSDRHGRRRFLLVYEAIQAGSAVLALASNSPPALVTAALLGGFGRGANGGAGPFAPLEQAWLAHAVPASKRGLVFSLNAAVGFLGMAIGALAAGAVHFLEAPLGPILAYRPLFLLPLAGSLFAFTLIARLPEPRFARGPRPADEHAARRDENRTLARLVLINILNGLGIGMVAPLIAYWFALRFHHGPGTIGPALAGSFLLGGLGSLLVGRLSSRAGLIRPVVMMRILGLALLVAVPLVPEFGLSAGLYALRRGATGGTAGVRQALVMALTRDRRGLAASVHNVSIQIPRAIGPLLSGILLQAGMLETPFFVAAALQAAYLLLYVRLFRDFAMAAGD